MAPSSCPSPKSSGLTLGAGKSPCAAATEPQALAAELAAALPPDTTLALHGNLGVGKTTFVQGLARGLGLTEPVTSPTFNIYTVHRAAGPRVRPAAEVAIRLSPIGDGSHSVIHGA